jgi:hypothetical protein
VIGQQTPVLGVIVNNKELETHEGIRQLATACCTTASDGP